MIEGWQHLNRAKHDGSYAAKNNSKPKHNWLAYDQAWHLLNKAKKT
jgi:hypothetical protein